MKRHSLRFNVRCYSEIPLPEMGVLVGEALGCAFQDGEYFDTPALVASMLGMRVGLYDWRGLDNAVVFILSSHLDEGRFLDAPAGEAVEIESVDISQAVADLLTVRGVAGEWHPPTEAEVEAERAHGGRRAERIRREERES